MSKADTLIIGIAVCAIVISGAAFAQDAEQPPLYLSVDCMKSTSADYTNVELEIWQAMHQELVNQGKRNSWALYWVMYGDRSKCDYFTVTTYLGDEQLNHNPSIDEVFKTVHPDDDFAEAMARTWASRRHVATELWLAVDGTEVKEHRFAVVNMMNAFDPDAYEQMESRVFKAGHQALLDSGHRAGWGMYVLVAPTGTSTPYNYSTVDFSNVLNPVPMAEAMLAANPDRDLSEMHDLLELRKHVSSQTWSLITSTENSPSEALK
jgi:hypothetical protein